MNGADVESEIIELYNEGKWREILDRHSENSFLPWIWPQVRDLEFIASCFRAGNGRTLISVGCGSGLLEWLLSESTGVNVVGIELDRSWWTSKYARKTFIPIHFVDKPDGYHELVASEDAVLLFCYFNNEKAFVRYIEAFKGDHFIVIGPGPGKSTYTIPEPFSLPHAVDQRWKLTCHREIGSTEDYIAMYSRLSPGILNQHRPQEAPGHCSVLKNNLD